VLIGIFRLPPPPTVCYTDTMSRAKTTQIITHKDPAKLLEIQQEVHEYRGLKTKLEDGHLVVYLMDSKKYWDARKPKKKKSKYDDYDEE
jgi:hypothetical protein